MSYVGNKKAVALAYPENAAAPIISAVGTGKTAEQIVDVAREHEIPVVQNDLLVSVLADRDIGTIVPETTWTVLAKIFAFVVKNEEKL